MAFTDDPGAEEQPLAGLVAPLNADTAARIQPPPPPSFAAALRDAAPLDPTTLGVDDALDITIWESEGAGMFGPEGGPTVLSGVVIDPQGHIFVPFVGQVDAAGATVSTLRMRIQRALEPLSLAPQVDVRLTTARSRSVALQGAVARPGVYPIERNTQRLAQMLASAGGVTSDPERLEIAVQRDGVISRQLLLDLLESPAFNIALRPRDLITVTPIRERFVVLGAATVQGEVAFPTRPLTLLSALGAARGLRDFDADPTGVFVFRYETPAIADALLDGPPPEGLPAGPGRPIVYRLDLSRPQSLFVARRFAMRDGDGLFVTNAPLTELRKVVQLFTSALTPVNAASASPVAGGL